MVATRKLVHIWCIWCICTMGDHDHGSPEHRRGDFDAQSLLTCAVNVPRKMDVEFFQVYLPLRSPTVVL